MCIIDPAEKRNENVPILNTHIKIEGEREGFQAYNMVIQNGM